jgi:endoglucanase
MQRFCLIFSCCLLLAGCGSGSASPGAAVAGTPATGTPVVHVESGRVVGPDRAPLDLHSVNLGDLSFVDPDPHTADHDGTDFERLAAMGANQAGLFFNYQILEDDAAPLHYKQSGLDWLDQNVAWARENGLYLQLILTNVPDGAPGDCGNDAFWESPDAQDRYVALWSMLAARYAQEPTIASYELFAAPNPDQSLDQWQALATRVASEIRKVDPDHLLVVERANSIACTFELPAEQTFPVLEDSNVLYGFAYLEPWDYTAQLLASSGRPEYGPYPGNEKITPDWYSRAKQTTDSSNSRPDADSLYVPPGDSDWSLEHFFYTVADEKLRIGQPVLQSNYNTGTVYFDDIVINEYDENANFVGVVADIDPESADGYYFWQGDADGNDVAGPGVAGRSSDAHRGKYSVTISGTTSQANLGDQTQAFPVQFGHTYELSGWTKGKQSQPRGASFIRIDFFTYEGDLGTFDKAALAAGLDAFVAWQKTHGLPLGVVAFGTGIPTFADNRGGLTWVSDMIDLMFERDLPFAYHLYHSNEWGIYANADGLPDPNAVNQPLVDLLTAKLH